MADPWTPLPDALLAQMLGRWRDSDGTLAERLGRRLVSLVDEGAVPDGVALPTERVLAHLLGVSRSTVTGGYRYAKEAGRLESRQGAGSWARGPRHRSHGRTGGTTGTTGSTRQPVPVRPENPAFTTLGRPPEGTIDFTLAETRCAEHTRTVLEDLDPGWLLRTTTGTGYHPQGLPALREALAAHLGGQGHRTGPDATLVTTGAQQAISLTATVCCPPGSTVLVEEASYPGALEAFRRLGLRMLPIPTDPLGPDPRALADLLARTRPTLVYLVPVGNNPTGAVVPGERLDALADVLARSGAVLLEDRTAAPLADPAATPAPLAGRLPREAAVVVGSMSKVAWAGVRVGWMLAPPAVLRDALAARVAGDLAGSAVSQALAVQLVPHLPRLAAEVRAELAAGHAALRAALTADLPEWVGPEPAAGAWRWVRIPADARTFARAAADAGVLVAPGPLFSPHALLSDHLRIAAVAPPEVLVAGVARLRTAWESVRHSRPAPADGRDLLLI